MLPERLAGRQIPVPGGIDVTFHEPMGVVGVIVRGTFRCPWQRGDSRQALAAGNTVMSSRRSTRRSPRCDWRNRAGGRAPPDVLQVVPGTGTETGEHLVGHPLVRKVVFTGSTATGKRIMRLCADQVKPLTLELGGKNANIVFADADLERAAASAPGAAFDNAARTAAPGRGSSCSAAPSIGSWSSWSPPSRVSRSVIPRTRQSPWDR